MPVEFAPLAGRRLAPGSRPHYITPDEPTHENAARCIRSAAHSRLPRSRTAGTADRRVGGGGAPGAAVHPADARIRQAVLGADDQLRAAGLGVGLRRLPLSEGAPGDRRAVAADS